MLTLIFVFIVIFIFIFITNTIQVLMPGGPKLTPTDPEKKKVMEKWINQGAMMMRSTTIIINALPSSPSISIVILLLVVLIILDITPVRWTRRVPGKECQVELEI